MLITQAFHSILNKTICTFACVWCFENQRCKVPTFQVYSQCQFWRKDKCVNVYQQPHKNRTKILVQKTDIQIYRDSNQGWLEVLGNFSYCDSYLWANYVYILHRIVPRCLFLAAGRFQTVTSNHAILWFTFPVKSLQKHMYLCLCLDW